MWKSVLEELPSVSGDYLVTDGSSIMVTNYTISTHRFNCIDEETDMMLIDFWTHDQITHWDYLPMPPTQKVL